MAFVVAVVHVARVDGVERVDGVDGVAVRSNASAANCTMYKFYYKLSTTS
jgi:hypothetical protein